MCEKIYATLNDYQYNIQLPTRGLQPAPNVTYIFFLNLDVCLNDKTGNKIARWDIHKPRGQSWEGGLAK